MWYLVMRVMNKKWTLIVPNWHQCANCFKFSEISSMKISHSDILQNIPVIVWGLLLKALCILWFLSFQIQHTATERLRQTEFLCSLEIQWLESNHSWMVSRENAKVVQFSFPSTNVHIILYIGQLKNKCSCVSWCPHTIYIGPNLIYPN